MRFRFLIYIAVVFCLFYTLRSQECSQMLPICKVAESTITNDKNTDTDYNSYNTACLYGVEVLTVCQTGCIKTVKRVSSLFYKMPSFFIRPTRGNDFRAGTSHFPSSDTQKDNQLYKLRILRI